MTSADELRKALAEAKLHLDDLLRTEYESRPAEEEESFLEAVAAVEDRVRELGEQLLALEPKN